jgi:hypothetical protein
MPCTLLKANPKISIFKGSTALRSGRGDKVVATTALSSPRDGRPLLNHFVVSIKRLAWRQVKCEMNSP